jgi:hypothetical protein
LDDLGAGNVLGETDDVPDPDANAGVESDGSLARFLPLISEEVPSTLSINKVFPKSLVSISGLRVVEGFAVAGEAVDDELCLVLSCKDRGWALWEAVPISAVGVDGSLEDEAVETNREGEGAAVA